MTFLDMTTWPRSGPSPTGSSSSSSSTGAAGIRWAPWACKPAAEARSAEREGNLGVGGAVLGVEPEDAVARHEEGLGPGAGRGGEELGLGLGLVLGPPGRPVRLEGRVVLGDGVRGARLALAAHRRRRHRPARHHRRPHPSPRPASAGMPQGMFPVGPWIFLRALDERMRVAKTGCELWAALRGGRGKAV